jgi:outer membrane protein assembly factor BamB
MRTSRLVAVIAGTFILTPVAIAQDWPQWRGPNRDAKATGFVAPKEWPKELTQKWKVTVGDGVATPALVGDKLYVFSREGGSEIVRCLDAATGKDVWQDKYETPAVNPPAQSFSGPRSSPAVADGKVVTLGVHGILNCYDAATGKKLWSKADLGQPGFATSCSPVIAEGLCIVQIGGDRNGGVAAYDLATGNEKWKAAEDGTKYSSPMVVGKTVVAETSGSVVDLSLADGKVQWRVPLGPPAPKGGGGMGGGGRYNAPSPLVEGSTLFVTGAGRGVKAFKVGEGEPKPIWANDDVTTQYGTPVLKDKLLYVVGSDNKLVCLSAETGKTEWSTGTWQGDAAPPAKGGMKGGGGGGYGSVVDVGPVLMALTPVGKLVVFEATGKDFKPLATYKVAAGQTYAYPVISGNRVFIKDKDAVTLWAIGQ